MALTHVELYEALKPSVGEKAAAMMAQVIPPAEDLARKQDITMVLLAISELRSEVQRDLKQTTRWMIALFLPLWAGVAGTVVAIALKH